MNEIIDTLKKRESFLNHRYADLTNRILIAYQLGHLKRAHELEKQREDFTKKTGYKA